MRGASILLVSTAWFGTASVVWAIDKDKGNKVSYTILCAIPYSIPSSLHALRMADSMLFSNLD